MPFVGKSEYGFKPAFKFLISIPCMDQLYWAKCSLAQWDWMTSESVHFLLIDNGSQHDNYQDFLARYNLAHRDRWHYLRNETNVGMIRSSQQAYEYAREHGYTHLALAHNDVWVYQQFWNQAVKACYQAIPKLGGIGFFGSKGCGKEGHRLNTMGNVLDPGHGDFLPNWRSFLTDEGTFSMNVEYKPACIFDGFFQCYSMNLLNELNGFDQRYDMMHVYDYDFSLSSIWAGWKNIVLAVPCHHLSGLTANNSAASTSGQDKHEINHKLWAEKWQDRLGVSVDENFNYRWNQ